MALPPFLSDLMQPPLRLSAFRFGSPSEAGGTCADDSIDTEGGPIAHSVILTALGAQLVRAHAPAAPSVAARSGAQDGAPTRNRTWINGLGNRCSIR